MNVIRRDAVTMPTESELRRRIERHLLERPDQEAVAQAWDSYLAALLEWGLLDRHAYVRLSDSLPPHDRRAVEEILLGFDGIDDPRSRADVTVAG